MFPATCDLRVLSVHHQGPLLENGDGTVRDESMRLLGRREADTELNRVYQHLLAKLKGDDKATKKLRAAQKAWLAFRDAHLQELYPAEDKQGEYGSIFPMRYSQVETAMARERTAQVRRMLDDKDPCDVSGKHGF